MKNLTRYDTLKQSMRKEKKFFLRTTHKLNNERTKKDEKSNFIIDVGTFDFDRYDSGSFGFGC